MDYIDLTGDDAVPAGAAPGPVQAPVAPANPDIAGPSTKVTVPAHVPTLMCPICLKTYAELDAANVHMCAIVKCGHTFCETCRPSYKGICFMCRGRSVSKAVIVIHPEVA